MSTDTTARTTNAGAPVTGAPDRQRQRGAIRRPALILVGLILIAGALGAYVYWHQVGRFYEDTDDAYVNGRLVTVTPQVGGTVIAVGADETDTVKAGDMLVQLDPLDARVELDRREAQLAQAVRETRNLFASNTVLEANIRVRETELHRAQDDLDRRNQVAGSGVVSQEEIQHAKAHVAEAEAALVSAREQLEANRVQTGGTTVTHHPRVMAAAAQVREAYLDLQRGKILAPVAGQVARRAVQVGQRLTPGNPILSLVPMDNLWVDANFKEVQLGNMRIGQPVTLVADIYGDAQTYHGKVIGLGAGTGAAFALLPAQNATGNWIKVVQRLPVKIALDPQELREHPLRVGLSMKVKVDLHAQDGALVSVHSVQSPDNTTAVYDHLDRDADALIQRIIAQNLGAEDRPAQRTANHG